MIVLPMAGLSSRFARAGYDRPKYMLPLAGRPVLAHVVAGFSEVFGAEPILFVCRDVAGPDGQGTPDFVRATCAAMGLGPDDARIAVLDAPTDGQAETVAAGLDAAGVDDATPVTIFNIDTFHAPGGFRHPARAAGDAFDGAAVDGWLEVFRGPGAHWSFVAPAPGAAGTAERRAARVAEKVRISDLCSTGLYHFRDAGLFRSLYAPVAGADPAALQGGERYVAPLYQAAIEAGRDVRWTEIARDAIHFCGTPDEYEALRREMEA